MDDADQEQLRRRLYEPGASQADIEAYRAVEPRGAPEHHDVGAVRSRSALRAGAAGAAIALAAVGVVALVVAHPFAPSRDVPTPTTTTAAVDAGEVPVPASARAAFLSAFDDGDDPQLLGWLDAHPDALLTRLRGAGRPDSTEFTGVGPATITLSPTTPAERSGRFTVVLVTDQASRFEWEATRVAMSNDRSGPEQPVATHDGSSRAGVPVSGTVVYSTGVPTRLTVLLPTGARWAAVVVYSS